MSNKTKLHFLDGFAPLPGLLGIFGFPIAYEGKDVEHTRFLTLQKRRTQPNGLNHEGWKINLYNSDLVSMAFEVSERGNAWWLLGKRGNVHSRGPAGSFDMQIKDAGTGLGRYGYLNALRMINGSLYACGYRRQIYKYTNDQWVHCDEAILLKNRETEWFTDITGNAEGALCAVGTTGSIAIGINDVFSMQDSPTNVHLNAVCVDDDGLFCACGDYRTVLRGNADGFSTLCIDAEHRDPLWDIEWFQGQLVVSSTEGLFVLHNGELVPFFSPPPPSHVGHKLSKVGDILWSIGENNLMCLENGKWTEWICPENLP